MLVFAALVTALGAHNQALVLTGLILLGLGWSASTVAGSALLNDAAPVADRVRLQGRGDLAMNLAGALGRGAVRTRSWPSSDTPGWPGVCCCRSRSWWWPPCSDCAARPVRARRAATLGAPRGAALNDGVPPVGLEPTLGRV